MIFYSKILFVCPVPPLAKAVIARVRKANNVKTKINMKKVLIIFIIILSLALIVEQKVNSFDIDGINELKISKN